MGRERKNHENLTARFPAGTLARIERALRGREGKADFIRAAVAEKLALRERKLPTPDNESREEPVSELSCATREGAQRDGWVACIRDPAAATFRSSRAGRHCA